MTLSVKNAAFAYPRGRTVFESLSFDVRSGEILTVLGANGSGKTTLLKCIMGFLRFTEGDAFIDDERVRDIPARRMWQRIAYVPQARSAYSSLDVKNMILLGTASRIGVFSSPGRREEELVGSIADRLGVSHLLTKKCNEISGGELQMALICRALAAEPDILVLDEPESNLDFRNQLIVLDSLSSLARDGMCCIFNTHYPDHALARADKAVLLCADGYVFGKTSEVVTADNIRRAFGVNAVIGEIDSDGERYRTVIPAAISAQGENNQ